MNITKRFDEILKEELKKKKLDVEKELKKFKKTKEYREKINNYFDEIHPY
jgi:Leu/Phe-tRNA-protein transferase